MSPHVAGTTPYPWPFDGDLAGTGTALVVVVPDDFAVDPDGHAAEQFDRLATAVRRAGGVLVVATTTTPARPGRSLPDRRAVPGLGAPQALAGRAPDLAVRSRGVDAFYGSELDAELRNRGIRRLLLAGVGLETSVHSTMRDANDRGYECLLVVDASTPIDRTLVDPAVSMIEMSGGIFGAVGRVADVIRALVPAPEAETDLTTPQGALT